MMVAPFAAVKLLFTLFETSSSSSILPIILLHGITFVWILIFQCAKKSPPKDNNKKSEMKPPQSAVSAAAPKQSQAPAPEPAKTSNVPKEPKSIAQNSATKNNGPTGNGTSHMTTQGGATMTQTQHTKQESQVSTNKPTGDEDTGGYANLDPNAKPVESEAKKE